MGRKKVALVFVALVSSCTGGGSRSNLQPEEGETTEIVVSENMQLPSCVSRGEIVVDVPRYRFSFFEDTTPPEKKMVKEARRREANFVRVVEKGVSSWMGIAFSCGDSIYKSVEDLESECVSSKGADVCLDAGGARFVLGDPTSAVKNWKIGCKFGSGPSCRLAEKWSVILQKEGACLGKSNADACYWLAVRSYEKSELERATKFAALGCSLQNQKSCALHDLILRQYEADSGRRAADAATTRALLEGLDSQRRGSGTSSEHLKQLGETFNGKPRKKTKRVNCESRSGPFGHGVVTDCEETEE